jgi:hypothetical protein
MYSLILVCRLTHCGVYLIHFEVSKASYIFVNRESIKLVAYTYKHKSIENDSKFTHTTNCSQWPILTTVMGKLPFFVGLLETGRSLNSPLVWKLNIMA